MGDTIDHNNKKRTTMNEQITTTCYGHTDKWASREQAVRYFQECAMCSEGAEKERYTNIILQLLDGQTDCHD